MYFSMQSTDVEYPSFLKKQQRILEPTKHKNHGQNKKSREAGSSSNPWRRPEKGSKKRKATFGESVHVEKKPNTKLDTNTTNK